MKNYSTIYRILHWTIAIAFILLLITIFLRSTWLDKNNIAAIIENFLKDKNQSLTHDEVISLSKKIRQPMWDWHIYLGYFLTGAFILRFMLPVFGIMKLQNPFTKNLTVKEKFQNWTYIIFYLCVVVSLFTGLMMKFGPENLNGTMEDIHVLGIYYLIGFMVIHIGGVLIAEFTDKKGIVSSIISGAKKNN